MRYFAGFLVVLALILFGIVIFGGTGSNGGKKSATNPQAVVKTLPDYANTGAVVRVTIDGPINGDDMHRQIRMTISSGVRTLDIVQGYQGNVIQTESFANNVPAYSAFLNALYRAGYTLKLNPKVNKFTTDNDLGACAQGSRYYFELMNTGNNADQRYWSSSCGPQLPGNFGGAGSLIVQLFGAQYNNYGAFTAVAGIQ